MGYDPPLTVIGQEGQVRRRSASHQIRSWTRDVAPVIVVLLVTTIFSFVQVDSSVLSVCKAPLRFLRFAFLLCAPLYMLPRIYRLISRKKAPVLLRIEHAEAMRITPVKQWIFRPFQGIGIGLLFGTKLISVLQLIAGPSVGSSLLIPEGHFQIARLLMITAITILVSLLLSTLWTLDDLGIRYYNRKDQEVKMLGKYAGTLMPVIFGFYGILNLLANYPTVEGLLFVFKIIVVLYPPLGLFAVLHTYFVRSRRVLFMENDLQVGGIWRKE